MNAQLTELANRAGTSLVERNWKIATVESCTGGWIAEALTSVAGSSEWFERGFVTYSNEAKQELVGVGTETLLQYGAVSREVAREMSQGGIRASRADISVAVTGVAGPSGGSAQKPVGTVWLAWADRNGGEVQEQCLFDGDRHRIRLATVERALNGVLEFVARTGALER